MASKLNSTPEESFIARFLHRLPPDVAASFTADQLAAVRRAFGMRYVMDHAVDVRRSVTLPWGRFYLVLLGGRDWRQEGGRSRWRTLISGAGACIALLVGWLAV